MLRDESGSPRRWLLTNDRLGSMDTRHIYGRLDDGESVQVMPVAEHEEQLFAAFLAGFDASGEGFNGEYTRESVRGEKLEQRLRSQFELWLRNNEEGR